MPPGPHGVEADDVETVGAVNGLGALPLALELGEGPREAGREGARNIVVSGDHEQGSAEPSQEGSSTLVLVAPAAMREVPSDHDQLRSDPLDQRLETALYAWCFDAAHVQIGDVEEAQRQRRSRLYTEIMADESTEIFDDLYLGLRAGGAIRKQRRGEPLTTEEQEAIGRWERLSSWRKAVAIGAFSVGTFGLGFTLGGLIFGRWRKA
jgi:hypothetical protein